MNLAQERRQAIRIGNRIFVGDYDKLAPKLLFANHQEDLVFGWLDSSGQFTTGAGGRGLPTPTNQPSAFNEGADWGIDLVTGKVPKGPAKSMRKPLLLRKALFRAPAFRRRDTGEIIEGKPGQTHGDIWEAHQGKPTKFDSARADVGFVSHKGKFYNRKQATKVAQRYYKLHDSKDKMAMRGLEAHAGDPSMVKKPPKGKFEPLVKKSIYNPNISKEAEPHYKTFAIRYKGIVIPSETTDMSHFDISKRRFPHLAHPSNSTYGDEGNKIQHGYVTHQGEFHPRNKARAYLRSKGVKDPESSLDWLHDKNVKTRIEEYKKQFGKSLFLKAFTKPIDLMILQKNHRLHYKTEFAGLPISVENRKGSIRKWKDVAGNKGKTKMKVPYGYIRGTKGADGDEVDVYLGPNDLATHGFVVRQVHPDTGAWDEDKIILGADDIHEARGIYLAHRNDGTRSLGRIDQYPLGELRQRVFQTKHKPGFIQ